MPTANDPFPYFPEAGTGGFIYIGAVNQDAQSNPITVYRDAARTIPWAQPIRTVDGYPAYQGAKANIFANVPSWSITVQDRNGQVVTRKNSNTADQIFISVKDFGAVGDGVTNDWAAFQAATDYAMSFSPGATVYIPDGRYRIDGQVTQNRSSNPALGVVSWKGAGRDSVFITHSGATACFSIQGHPTASEGQTLYPEISGMTILGGGATNEVGIGMTLVSFAHIENILMSGFDYAYYLQDVDHTSFNACSTRWNTRGLFARQNPTPIANSTQPNQFTFNECWFNNNSLYGLYNQSGVNWTFSGCSIENNGFAFPADGFGIKFDQTGYQGGAACSFVGTYFESNSGVADVVLVQDVTTSPVITQATYNFFGCSFNRTRATNIATNCILCNFAAAANVGDQILNLVGCTFKSFNNYVPNVATPYVAFIGAGQPRNHINFNAPGTIFKDAVEAPSYVQRITKPSAEITNTVNQSIPNATPTIWQINSIGRGFSWTTSINGSYQISIPEAGNYSFAASVTFQTNVTGARIEILKGSQGIASNTDSGTDTLTASTVKYCTVGEFISVRVTHTTGAAATIANGNIAQSYLNIQKVMDQ